MAAVLKEKLAGLLAPAPGLQNGFTLRVLGVMFFISIVMLPALLWTELAAGWMMSIAAAFTAMILFGELGWILGKPLTEQELATIRWAASMSSQSSAGAGVLFAIYFFTMFPLWRGVASAFGWSVPWWIIPPPAEYPEIYVNKLIFHPAWLLPLGVSLALSIFSLISVIGLSLVLRQQYIEIERLPFPTGVLGAEAARSLGQQRQPLRVKFFYVGAVVGFLYFFVWQIIPTIEEVMGIIPPTRIIEFIYDWTPYMAAYGAPGVIIGILPHILLFTIGFIVTLDVSLGIFLTSIFIYCFVSWYLYTIGSPYAWEPGDDWYPAWLKIALSSQIGVSSTFGLLLAGTFIPFFMAYKAVIRGFKDLFKVRKALELGVLPADLTLASFFVPGFFLALLWWILADCGGDYGVMLLIWYLFAWLVLSWVTSMVAARMNGESGIMFSGGIPYLYTILFFMTGYVGLKGWWLGRTASDAGAIPIGYKAAQLTNTDPKSIIFAHFFGNLMALVIGYFWGLIFWWEYGIMTPALPCPFFPFSAVFFLFFATGGKFTVFNWLYVLISFIVGAVAFAPRLFIGFTPISPVGMSIGALEYPHAAITIFIGGVARYILIRLKGREWFSNYGMAAGAGIYAGVGIAMVIDTLIRIVYFWTTGVALP
ncbi:hypothetical protein DRO02_02115 [archaeon]|nr:MAG: hypothetical protein DRO21_03510 [archaeon]RLG65351.1 MAG: hypothetical protein DRO02_02115 [archaeon]